jgi:putative selenate reductase molybdopterin-binding subunit
MKVAFRLNGRPVEFETPANTTLLGALREHFGLYGAKHGCETGECGACAILLDGRPVNSCVLLAAQAESRHIVTVESVGEHPRQGWRRTPGLDPLQEAFVETGAIQCGYCTPAMILAARALLSRSPSPSEGEVREALSGVLCRCTGYVKPVHAIQRAAAVLRGE